MDILADGFVPSLSSPHQDGTTLGATVLDRYAVAVLDGSSGTVRWIRGPGAPLTNPNQPGGAQGIVSRNCVKVDVP